MHAHSRDLYVLILGFSSGVGIISIPESNSTENQLFSSYTVPALHSPLLMRIMSEAVLGT